MNTLRRHYPEYFMVDLITVKATSIQSQEAVLVAISGIDGSGKGTITRKVINELKNRNLNAVSFNLDLRIIPNCLLMDFF